MSEGRTQGVTAQALNALTGRPEMSFLIPYADAEIQAHQMAHELVSEGRVCINCHEIPGEFIVIPSQHDISLLCRTCINWINHIGLLYWSDDGEPLIDDLIEDTVKLLVKIHTETSA